MLLGFTADGEVQLLSKLDNNILLKKPYMLIVLTQILEKRGEISGVKDLSRELVSRLISEPIKIVSYIDPDFVDSVLAVD